MTAKTREPRIAIVGTGMSGICMAAQLERAGISTYVVFEKTGQVGGTWRDNTYPGLTCDVPSKFYQYTFAPEPDWTHLFPAGNEIWNYFDRVVDSFGIRDHIRFHTEVISAEYQDGQWQVTTADGGQEEFDFLIAACGILHHPRYPSIEGMDSFAGDMFHTARWDHSVPIDGRRVAVVGTGSTGVQVVAALAGRCAKTMMFQRTAPWLLPFGNRRTSRIVRAAHRRVPALNLASYRFWRMVFELFTPALTKPGLRRWLVQNLSRRHLRKTVKDLDLRRKLTPSYEPGCKRFVVSSTFYDAVQRDNVDVVTDAIEQIETTGVRTKDGTLHEADVVVLATGFEAHAYMRPMKLVGEGGLTIEDAWRDGPRAYHTVAVPGFPNFFMFMGPNSPVGNYALTAIAESQGEHIMYWIERWRAGAIDVVTPRSDATARFNREIRAAMRGTVWASGCDSWYIGRDGQPELFPWPPNKHRAILRDVRPTDFTTQVWGPDGQVRA